MDIILKKYNFENSWGSVWCIQGNFIPFIWQ